MVDGTKRAGRPASHARTDRQPLGRSAETAPESLYLWRIAVLERRVAALRTEVERRERDRQHVIDRYETLLEERQAHRGELLTDGGTVEPDADSLATRALARVRRLL